MLLQEGTVDCHVIDALPGLLLDHVQEVLRAHVDDVVHLPGHLVDRHRAHRHAHRVDDPLADGLDVCTGGEVHHRVGPVVDGGVDLLQLAVGVAGQRRVAQVGVDLGAAGDADAHRAQAFLQVDPVGGNDHAPARDLAAHELGLELLALGDGLHLGRDDARSGLLDLGHRAAVWGSGFRLQARGATTLDAKPFRHKPLCSHFPSYRSTTDCQPCPTTPAGQAIDPTGRPAYNGARARRGRAVRLLPSARP